MSRVEIDDHGRKLTLDHVIDDTPAALAEFTAHAEKVWTNIYGTSVRTEIHGPAYGFAHERDNGLLIGTDKRFGGEISPTRALFTCLEHSKPGCSCLGNHP